MKHLNYFPQPLLDDIIKGKCIPFIGAGFSRNADIPDEHKMPLWDELGKKIASYIPDYEYAGPVDALSAYSHEYSLAKLVEQLSESLLLNIAQPGLAHKAFCELPFDFVCTTNIEFLLEKGYDSAKRYCCPIVEEDQLSVTHNSAGVNLLKLHGDLHHPNRLVLTEEQYDGFIERYPLLATFLANLLISRTPLFIGYSLDDPDFRHIWQIIGDRLGKMRRMAYAIMVNAKPHNIARYERRGIKVINITGKEADYATTLEQIFKEIREFWSEKLIQTSTITEEDSLTELSLPKQAKNRLCFFAIPFRILSFYRSKVFPIAERYGFAPITSEEVLSPGANNLAKISAIIDRSELIVIDVASPYTMFEYGMIRTKYTERKKVLVIKEEDFDLPQELNSIRYVLRPKLTHLESEEFITQISRWFQDAAEMLKPDYEGEPRRLFEKGEYRASVISSISLLENELRMHMDKDLFDEEERAFRISLNKLLRIAVSRNIIGNKMLPELQDWVEIRNSLVHSKAGVNGRKARKIIDGVYEIVNGIHRR